MINFRDVVGKNKYKVNFTNVLNTNNDSLVQPLDPTNCSEIMNCYEFPCPTNCTVSQWSNWSSCLGDCSGIGYRSRERNIEERKYDGTCDENLKQIENCTLIFSEWTEWSECAINSLCFLFRILLRHC